MNFPLGGKELWDMRVAGKRPDDMVVVSLVGPIPLSNPVLWIGDRLPDATLRTLEWRMLADLEVEVIVEGKVPVDRLLTVLRAIRPHAESLFVYYRDAGFTLAVKWLAPSLPTRIIGYDAELPDADTRRIARSVQDCLRRALSIAG